MCTLEEQILTTAQCFGKTEMAAICTDCIDVLLYIFTVIHTHPTTKMCCFPHPGYITGFTSNDNYGNHEGIKKSLISLSVITAAKVLEHPDLQLQHGQQD